MPNATLILIGHRSLSGEWIGVDLRTDFKRYVFKRDQWTTHAKCVNHSRLNKGFTWSFYDSNMLILQKHGRSYNSIECFY